MRIAIIVRHLNVSGGTQRAAICLARELRERGHDAVLYTFSYSRQECYPKLMQGVPVVEADRRLVGRVKTFGARRGVIAFIKTSFYQNRVARDLAHKIPKETDVLNPHDQVVDRVAAYFKRDIRHIPSVWMVNDVSTRNITVVREKAISPTLRISLLRRIAHWLIDTYEYRAFARYQDCIMLLDSRDQRWANDAYPSIKTTVVRNGLSVEEFPFFAHAGIQNKRIRLLAFAILLPHRRFEDAIRAVALLRARGYEAYLSIVGEPADRKYADLLQKVASEERVQAAVTFLGKVSAGSLRTIFRDADIFVFPCHLQSWGLAVFEAMASGLPVIVSETSGASEVLTHGKNAMIVPPFTPEAIAGAAEKLSDAALYQAISTAGRKFVEENISWERYADQILEYFTEAQKQYK